jgi:acylphosphatase
MRVARRYLITGRVQGVGYRYFTQDMAAHEGIHGWVRNLPDGSVEVSAEGELEALERFEHRLRTGPPHARVTDVQVSDSTPKMNNGFSVR